MKKVLIAMMLVGVLMLLPACDASVSSSGTGTDGEAAPAEAVKTEFQIGEAINVDDAVMTVVSAQQFPPPNEYMKPTDGKVYYIINITIANGGAEPLDYNEYNYKIEDANGVQTSTAFVTDIPNQMNSGSLAPGGRLDSNIVFEVPADMASLKLIMEPNFFSTQQVKIILTP